MTRKAREEAEERARIAAEEAKKRIAAAAKLAKYEKEMAEARLRGDDADKYSEKSREIQERYFKRMFALYRKDSEEYKNLVLEKEQWLQDWENHFIEEGKKEDEENKKTLESFNKKLKSEKQLLKERYDTLIQAAKKVGQGTAEIDKWYEEEKIRIEKESFNQRVNDSLKAERQILDERYAMLIDEATREGKDVTAILEQYEEEKVRIETENLNTAKILLDERYQELIDAATKEGEDTTAIVKWYEDEKTRITIEEAEKRVEETQSDLDIMKDFLNQGAEESITAKMEQLDTEYKMAIEAAERLGRDTNAIDQKYLVLKKKMWGSAYRQLAGNVSDILGSIGDMMAEGTEEQKGLAVASTTIQMLSGITAALSGVFTTHTGVWDIALAAAQAAAIAASGIANISKIKQVKPDGSGPGAVSAPSVSVPMVVNASPDFSQSVDGAMTQTSIRDQRVYVLEHDITETQNKVEVAEQRATY